MGKRENEYDFVGGHSEECTSEFAPDYFHFDSSNCSACAATVARLRAEREHTDHVSVQDAANCEICNPKGLLLYEYKFCLDAGIDPRQGPDDPRFVEAVNAERDRRLAELREDADARLA